MLRKNTIRLFFFMLLPLLFVQLLVAKRYGEPYPAIMFPGFGKVLPNELYPYRYERLKVHAYTATDTIPLTLDELFAPFPETALFAPMRSKLRFITETLTPATGNEQERELLRYLQHRTRTLLGHEVQRLELAFYQYEAEQDGRVRLAGISDRKTLQFEQTR